MKWFVYILRTSKNTLYTGITNDLDKRLKSHKEGKGAKYMRSFSEFELVYTEITQDRSDALKREAQIKRLTKQQKETLVVSFLREK
jgi:putative endonuclease